MWKVLIALLCCFCSVAFATEPRITQITPFGTSSVRISFNQDISKLKLNEYALKDYRKFIDIQAVLTLPKKSYNFANRTQVSIAQNNPKVVRIVISTNKDSTYQTKIVQNHLYISIIDKLPVVKETQKQAIKKPETKSQAKSTQNSKQEALKSSPNISKRLENIRKSKLKVVIDPGHGGKDCGAMGITKVCEKTIVLSVAKFLEQDLKKRGYTVYMTRDKDIYINLKERTDFANAKNADLFVSIHANSVPKTSNNSPQGIETYFLSTARSERARNVAEAENKDDIDIMNYFSKISFLNSLNSHRLIASNKLALDIQVNVLKELRKNYQGVIDGGIREGPFWVLAGALMPSVLIEIGYNSNPIEARRIDDKRYQRFLAKGIADGIEAYFAKNY